MAPHDGSATPVSTETPNPGSDEARALGCCCPVMDNNRGKRAPYIDDRGEGHYWITDACELHYKPAGASS